MSNSGRRVERARQATVLGLRHVRSSDLTWQRRRRGRGFSYHSGRGGRLRDSRAVRRIRGLAIPPAWRDVRIAADPLAHIQAVGVDEAGRRQYIYHPRWKTVREWRKVRRLLGFAASLPRVRAAIRRDLRSPAGSQRLALAMGAGLIDASAIRVGGERHYRRTGACGAVTLRRSHVLVNGRTVRLAFPAKGGKTFHCDLRSPHLNGPLRRLGSLPGHRLLVYHNDDGELMRLRAGQLNDYLRELAGQRISAKDFRTFQATALAADLLARITPAESGAARNRQIATAMREIAQVLGNTAAMVRNSYVHEVVLDCFASGDLAERWNRSGRRRRYLEPHEAALSRLLEEIAPPDSRTGFGSFARSQDAKER